MFNKLPILAIKSTHFCWFYNVSPRTHLVFPTQQPSIYHQASYITFLFLYFFCWFFFCSSFIFFFWSSLFLHIYISTFFLFFFQHQHGCPHSLTLLLQSSFFHSILFTLQFLFSLFYCSSLLSFYSFHFPVFLFFYSIILFFSQSFTFQHLHMRCFFCLFF